jgi:hypothetical protein
MKDKEYLESLKYELTLRSGFEYAKKHPKSKIAKLVDKHFELVEKERFRQKTNIYFKITNDRAEKIIKD